MLDPTQLEALHAELQADPSGLGYGKHLASEPGWIVDLLGRPEQSVRKTRWVTAVALLSLLDVQVVRKLLTVLAAAAQTDPIADLLLTALKSAQGINVADPNTEAVLRALVGADSLPQEFADQLLGLAVQRGTRAELLFGEGTIVEESDVRAALKGR